MKRAGHFFLTVLAGVTGFAVEVLAQPTSVSAHLGTWAPLVAMGLKWLHYEAGRLGGGGTS